MLKCALMAQKQWRVTLLALRTNQTVASNNTNSHCNLHHKTLLAGKKKKVPVSLKNILDKVVKKIVSQPLSTFICNILCDKMEVRIRCSTYTPKYDGYLEEEYLCDWVLGQISSFFSMEFQFYLKEHIVFWIWALGRHFLEN